MAAVLNSFIGQRWQSLFGNTIIAESGLDSADLIELAGTGYRISRQIAFEIPDAIRYCASIEFEYDGQQDGVARPMMHAELTRERMS